ncbi:ABC transporter ATP-binding protein [Agromyces larvae]|uniref:ABC transporter ATP-binding protein n=1 Tax=Agromyces larvae TaxID=2929802 RepID=A0ABY4BZ39_9MICO|nr:ABC transporter ATP-binding protein [Agromyces larvae]UOE44389.1 ABC transporter ATP-binding protein [Agromyces larvae]
MPAVSVSGLTVALEATGAPIIDDVSLSLEAGEVLGIVGESGSGKSTLSLAMLGYARPGGRITGGSVEIEGTDILQLDADGLRRARRGLVSYVAQDPATALNPSMRLSTQLLEALDGPRDQAIARVREVLSAVGLPNDDAFIKRRARELSGGQQQRIAIAMAVVAQPRLIVLDEPTTGLDVSTQMRVLELVKRLCAEYRIAAIYVTHDLAVVAEVADATMVMKDGHVVETGPAHEVLLRPQHPYSKALIAATPSTKIRTPWEGDAPAAEPSPSPAAAPLLRVESLTASYGHLEVLHDVDLTVSPGECVAIVGESGSGKSTLSRCLIGLHDDWHGTVALDGRPLAKSAADRGTAERRAMQYIFQNPYGSLNPRQDVGAILSTPLALFEGVTGAEARRRVVDALERVEMPARMAARYPSELSGGQRQRVAIARALLASPELLICDEVTSALDVLVQSAVIDLLRGLLRDGLGMIFVTHNLAVVRNIADRVVVVNRGTVVEHGGVDEVLDRPQDAYTRGLLANTLDLPAA